MAKWLRWLEQISVVLVGLLSLLVWAGSRAEPRVVPDDDEPAPMTFTIVETANPEEASPGTRTFVATGGTDDEQAKFLIVLNGKRVKGVDEKGGDPGIDIAFSSGSFHHMAGSKPGSFLRKLAIALEAKSPRLSRDKAEALPFDIAILSGSSARGPNGGFTGQPGPWVTTKLFLAGGDAEVYFNFDPVSGNAEFSIKDEFYGNKVVEELSKVLW